MRRLSYVLEILQPLEELDIKSIEFVHHNETVVLLPEQPDVGDTIIVLSSDHPILVQTADSVYIHNGTGPLTIDYVDCTVVFIFHDNAWWVRNVNHKSEIGIIPRQHEIGDMWGDAAPEGPFTRSMVFGHENRHSSWSGLRDDMIGRTVTTHRPSDDAVLSGFPDYFCESVSENRERFRRRRNQEYHIVNQNTPAGRIMNVDGSYRVDVDPRERDSEWEHALEYTRAALEAQQSPLIGVPDWDAAPSMLDDLVIPPATMSEWENVGSSDGDDDDNYLERLGIDK